MTSTRIFRISNFMIKKTSVPFINLHKNAGMLSRFAASRDCVDYVSRNRQPQNKVWVRSFSRSTWFRNNSEHGKKGFTMADVKSKVTTMRPGEGSDYFSENAKLYTKPYRSALSMIADCVGKINLEKDECFVFSEYGSADGGTSIPLVKSILECVKEQHGSNQEVHIIYEDQPTNDFNSLFRIINGLVPSVPSYLHDFHNVYVSACGTSIYQQCLPSASVHLGTSKLTVNWISKRPCQISDGLFPFMNANPEEHSKFEAQAAEDWQNALLARTRELKDGGQFLFWHIFKDDNHYKGNMNICDMPFMSDMNRFWRNLMEEQMITAEEFRNTNLNMYVRTIDEIHAPFCDPESAVSKAGLKFVHSEIQEMKGPLYSEWESAGHTAGDVVAAKAYAKAYISFMQKWFLASIYSGLSDERTPEEKDRIVNEFYKRLEQEVALDPAKHHDNHVLYVLHMEKQQ